MKWPLDKIFVQQISASCKIFCEKTAPQEKLMKENAPQARFFRLNPNGYFVLLM